MQGRRRRSRTPSTRVNRRRLLAMLGGGVLIGTTVSASGAFSTASATRSGAVGVVGDGSAFLGLDGHLDSDTVPVLTNNTNETMSITLDTTASIEFDVGDNGSWESPAVTFSLPPGGSELVNVRGSVSVASISIAVGLFDQGNPAGSITMIKDFHIPEAGGIKEIEGTFRSAGNSGEYKFDLENIGEVDVTMVAIGVHGTTNPEAITVDAGDILRVEGVSVMSSMIPVDSTDLSSVDRVDFDHHVDLSTGQTKSFEFDKFRRNATPPNADMRGEDVRVRMYFADDSSIAVNICIDECNF